ncbi:uncharacterized protein LOC130622565 [Hydractinia symbiolongicarpus]|uniref:uncharacterized protein LOC130622565 n=1 Tax=Hydractinia symbiolongicarpus TaxID=13093 RepID=UPI00254EB713|nr:uncharacterized protein LOC130622565 [Hydractinia symbiolongicarpus]
MWMFTLLWSHLLVFTCVQAVESSYDTVDRLLSQLDASHRNERREWHTRTQTLQDDLKRTASELLKYIELRNHISVGNKRSRNNKRNIAPNDYYRDAILKILQRSAYHTNGVTSNAKSALWGHGSIKTTVFHGDENKERTKADGPSSTTIFHGKRNTFRQHGGEQREMNEAGNPSSTSVFHGKRDLLLDFLEGNRKVKKDVFESPSSSAVFHGKRGKYLESIEKNMNFEERKNFDALLMKLEKEIRDRL